VFPKLNKLTVVSGTTGFTTSITVLADDELKSPLVQLPSVTAPWLVCSLVEEGVLDPLHALSEVQEVASCGALSLDILDNGSDAFKDEFSAECEDCGLPKIQGTAEEVTTASLMGSIFSCVGATLFDKGLGINNGTSCSEETATQVGEDNFEVKLDVVWFVTDVADPESSKFVFAALVFGTAAEKLLDTVSEVLLDNSELLAAAVWVMLSVGHCTCVPDGTLVSAALIISLTSAAEDTTGHTLCEVEVIGVVEAITSLLEEDGFLVKSSVDRQKMT
jgi:hypothetical protein